MHVRAHAVPALRHAEDADHRLLGLGAAARELGRRRHVRVVGLDLLEVDAVDGRVKSRQRWPAPLALEFRHVRLAEQYEGLLLLGHRQHPVLHHEILLLLDHLIRVQAFVVVIVRARARWALCVRAPAAVRRSLVERGWHWEVGGRSTLRAEPRHTQPTPRRSRSRSRSLSSFAIPVPRGAHPSGSQSGSAVSF